MLESLFNKIAGLMNCSFIKRSTQGRCFPDNFFIEISASFKSFFIVKSYITGSRSSHPRYSIRKGVLKNFAKLTGKHLCQSLFFNKVKKETLSQVFSCEFCEISKNTFFTEHLWATASKATKQKSYYFRLIFRISEMYSGYTPSHQTSNENNVQRHI